MDKTVFCEKCGKYVEVIPCEKELYCSNCDSVVGYNYGYGIEFDYMDEEPKSEGENERMYSALFNVLHDIPERVDMSESDLCAVLGWQEDSFERYYSGRIPSKKRQAILWKLYEDPEIISEFLV